MFGGASIHAVKEAFKTSSDKTPCSRNINSMLFILRESIEKIILTLCVNIIFSTCVYLFAIGNANRILNTNQYSEDTLLYKFGNTDDLPRRSGEHERNYKKIFKIDHIELMLFSVIDPKYIVDAETSLKKFFQNNIINFEKSTELVILDKSEYNKTIQHYKLIKNSYIGCYLEMQNKLDQLERKIKDLQNEYDLTKEKLSNKNTLLLEKHKNALQEKDNEIKLLNEKYNNLQKEIEYLQILKDKDIELLNIKLLLAQKQ